VHAADLATMPPEVEKGATTFPLVPSLGAGASPRKTGGVGLELQPESAPMKLDYQRHASGPMFENAFLERASRVHPVTPFVFYIPLIVALEAWALWRGVTTPLWSAAFVPVGWVAWQLMEYAIHRLFFHWEGSGPFTRRLHDIVHGFHHKYPDDMDRLVMPLGASIPLGLVVGGLLWLVGAPHATLPLFVGVVAGYLWYDFLHWSTHARKPLTAWGRALRGHHMAHHFNTPDKNFGISHRWVDRLVGSERQRPAREEGSGAGMTRAA
jgi:dihydroceramide fatty acyl 2-hydroxylase